MSQIQGGTNYTTGDQVTATNLDAHVNNAVLLPGAISDQASASALSLSDTTLVLQSGALKSATMAQVQTAIQQDLTAYIKSDGTTPMLADLPLYRTSPISGLTAAPVAYVDNKVASSTVSIASTAEVASFASVSKYISPNLLPYGFQSTNQSLGTNGYQKLPGGLILQWGSIGLSGGSGSVTFPISFPTAAYSVSLGLVSTYPVGGLHGYNNLTTSGMTVYCNNTAGAGASAYVTWIAIGS